MASKPDQPTPTFQIVVSDDHMEASFHALRACRELTPKIVLDALTAAKVTTTPEVQAEVDKLCKRETPPGAKEVIVLARGIAPVHATPPRVQPAIVARAEGEGRDRTSIPTAKEGEVVGTLIPGSPGKEGTDVTGKPVPFRAASDELPLGQNVRLDADGTSIIAVRPGLVQEKRGRIGVETTMEVPGNLDYSVGNVNFAGSILVRGNVADLFKVVASEDIYVGGAIEAADLNAGHNLEVHGGICCRDKGNITAGNGVRAKYISNTTVEAGGDITVQSEISNSRVICKGHLAVSNGPIYASHVSAAAGVTAVFLGSLAHAKTLIECGIDTALRRRAAEKLPEIQASLKRVAKVREVVEPLLAHQKNLTAAQKEKATEMLYDAKQVQEEAHETMKGIATEHQVYVTASTNAEVLVTGVIHPGVTIRFPGMETTIRMPIKGPVRIACRTVRGSRAIVAIDEATKVAHPLELRGVHDEVMEELSRTMNEGKQLETDPSTHAETRAA
jgi:uncharacterized protein (DUF342 family)